MSSSTIPRVPETVVTVFRHEVNWYSHLYDNHTDDTLFVAAGDEMNTPLLSVDSRARAWTYSGERKKKTHIGTFILRHAISVVWDFRYTNSLGVEVEMLIGEANLLRAEVTAFKHLLALNLIT